MAENAFFAYKSPEHVFDYVVAATFTAEAKNIAALNAAGEAVPGQDATAVQAIGAFKAGYAAGEDAQVIMGLMRFANDVAAPTVAADLFSVGLVGDDGTGISVSGAAGSGVPLGRIVQLDGPNDEWVWVNTLDRG